MKKEDKIIFDRGIFEDALFESGLIDSTKQHPKVTRRSNWRKIFRWIVGLLVLGFLWMLYLMVSHFCDLAGQVNPISPVGKIVLFIFVVVGLVCLLLKILSNLGF
jgi:polyferredoxin